MSAAEEVKAERGQRRVIDKGWCGSGGSVRAAYKSCLLLCSSDRESCGHQNRKWGGGDQVCVFSLTMCHVTLVYYVHFNFYC